MPADSSIRFNYIPVFFFCWVIYICLHTDDLFYRAFPIHSRSVVEVKIDLVNASVNGQSLCIISFTFSCPLNHSMVAVLVGLYAR